MPLVGPKINADSAVDDDYDGDNDRRNGKGCGGSWLRRG